MLQYLFRIKIKTFVNVLELVDGHPFTNNAIRLFFKKNWMITYIEHTQKKLCFLLTNIYSSL